METQRTSVVDKLYASSPTLQESNPASLAINLEGLHTDMVSRVLRDIYEDGQPIENDSLSSFFLTADG